MKHLTVRAFAGVAAIAVISLSALGATRDSVTLYGNEFLMPGLRMDSSDRTVRAIEKAVAPRRLVTRMVSIEELDEAVATGKADIVIAGAAIYRRHVQNGMRDIATLVTPLQPDPDHAVGGLIVTRRDRTDLNTLEDLQGKTLGVNHPVGFQGILCLKKDIADAGYDPDRFFGNIIYYGLDPRPRIEALLRKEVDAITLNVCYIERQAQQGNDLLEKLRPVAERARSETHCRASTHLYPNWSLLVSPNLDAATIVRIASAVHTMPAEPDGHQWTIASDFSMADALYKTLKMGPYSYLRSWTLERVWQQYGLLIAILLAALVVEILHHWRTRRLVDLRTRQLQQALQRQKELSKAAQQATQRYESARRIATVSQMSSLVAHELSQPLAGILLYCNGLRQLIQQKAQMHNFSSELLEQALDKIQARALKARDIVQAVRSYSKSSQSARTVMDLRDLVRNCVDEIVRSKGIPAEMISMKLPKETIPVFGNALELQLALSNLLRNSLEATSAVKKPHIDVKLASAHGLSARLCVSDNGPAVPDCVFKKISQPLYSLKDEGLGLGLSIVRGIAEGHLGQLLIERSESGSLVVTVILPISAAGKETGHD